MLETYAIESGLPLAERLYTAGVNLAPVGASPLGQLVAATHFDGHMVSSKSGNLNVDVRTMAEMANIGDSLTGYSEHDAVLKDIVAKALPGLLNQIAYARNQGSAVVEELAEAVTASVDKIGMMELSGASIVVNAIARPLVDPVLVQAVEESRQVVMSDSGLNMDLPDLTASEIRAMLMTGMSATDNAISEHFTNIADEKLVALWSALYTVGGRIGNSTLNTFIAGVDNVNQALFVFLSARRLFDKIIDGANMSEGSYKSGLAMMRNQAARRLCVYLDNVRQDDNTGQLIRHVDGLTVVVNETNYAKWLNAGGTADAIMGAVISKTSNALTLNHMLENAKVYEKAWRDMYVFKQQIFANKRFNRIKEILLLEYAHQSQQASPEDFPIHERQMAHVLFKQEVETITIDECEDMVMLCLRLLGASRFRGRSVCQILSGIAFVRKKNPDASASDAASVAIVEYVSRWVASMITYVKKQKLVG